MLRAANLIPDKNDSDRLKRSASAEFAMADRLSRQKEPGYIFELSKSADIAELREKRRQFAVRHGDNVYLPRKKELAIVFPNILLRCALFSASDIGDVFDGHKLAAHGDADIIMSGPQLCAYDRRVFGVFLQHYQNDEPLGIVWSDTTLAKISKEMGISYGKSTYTAIKSSLLRLNEVTLRIKIKGHPLPTIRLLEVCVDAHNDELNSQSGRQSGDIKVTFRMSEDIAMLFGHAEWTAISVRTLHDEGGLKAWLCAFYASHKGPWPFEIKDLYRKSGSKGNLADFRRRLKDGFLMLQKENIPISHRIARIERLKDKVTVYLSRWENLAKKPRT